MLSCNISLNRHLNSLCHTSWKIRSRDQI